MSPVIVTMTDATHSAAATLAGANPAPKKVAGYATGTPDIQWTSEDYARFPHSGIVRINQGATPVAIANWDVADVERYALTPADVPGLLEQRLRAGIEWTTIYGTDPSLEAVQAALKDPVYQHGWYYGHVDCWLCDESLDFAGAARLVGQIVRGMTCRAVQWASPASNPDTQAPGLNRTLAQANIDLSAADAAWHPAPAAAAAPKRAALVGTGLEYLGQAVSTDGKTWVL